MSCRLRHFPPSSSPDPEYPRSRRSTEPDLFRSSKHRAATRRSGRRLRPSEEPRRTGSCAAHSVMGVAGRFSELARKEVSETASGAGGARMERGPSFSEVAASSFRISASAPASCGAWSARVFTRNGKRALPPRAGVRALLGLCRLRLGRPRRPEPERLRRARKRGELGRFVRALDGRRVSGCQRGRRHRRNTERGERRTPTREGEVDLRARMPRRVQRLRRRGRTLLRSGQRDARRGCGVGMLQPLPLRRRLLGRAFGRGGASELRAVQRRSPLRPRLPKRERSVLLPRRNDLRLPPQSHPSATASGRERRRARYCTWRTEVAAIPM